MNCLTVAAFVVAIAYCVHGQSTVSPVASVGTAGQQSAGQAGAAIMNPMMYMMPEFRDMAMRMAMFRMMSGGMAGGNMFMNPFMFGMMGDSMRDMAMMNAMVGGMSKQSGGAGMQGMVYPLMMSSMF